MTDSDRPDMVVEAVLNRTRVPGGPTTFRCDDCGEIEPIMLLAVHPCPWAEPSVPLAQRRALCQSCYSMTRGARQLELTL